MTNNKNYGLDLQREKQELDGTEWKFGAASQPCLAQIPEESRRDYLPEGEVQQGLEDTMDCVSRAYINTLETKFNWLYANRKLSKEHGEWLRQNGYVETDGIKFSDRFIAILSGTTRSGNSMKAPVHAIHEFGLIPKSMLPLEQDMTWDEYHDPLKITEKMTALGREFLARFSINYEIVHQEHYVEELKNDILNVAAFAWPQPEKGIYPKVDYPPNHAFIIFAGKWNIFDNYIDAFDGDFIKSLAPDYNFLKYGYRVFISAEKNIKKNSWLKKLLEKLFNH